MRTIFFVLAALPFCATSHAVTTITADGVFEVEFVGGDEGPIIDPPFTGEGSFSLRENRWAAFSFDMFGHHWSIDDVDPIRCPIAPCFPDANGDLEVIAIFFADEAGKGFLFFDFLQGIFTGRVEVADMGAELMRALPSGRESMQVD